MIRFLAAPALVIALIVLTGQQFNASPGGNAKRHAMPVASIGEVFSSR